MAVLGLWLIVGAGIACGAVFAAFPSLDLAIAEFFRVSDAGRALQPATTILRDLNFKLTVVTLVLSGTALLWFAVQRSPFARPQARAAFLIVLAFALGPGLLANGLFKEFWGRPRPYQVIEFGGQQDFKAWWDPSGGCARNCSFISGEASSAFAMLAVAAAVPPPAQVPAIGIALLYGVTVGLMRMIVGGHFLSDVLFAGIFTALIVWLLHGWLFRWREARGMFGPWRPFRPIASLAVAAFALRDSRRPAR